MGNCNKKTKVQDVWLWYLSELPKLRQFLFLSGVHSHVHLGSVVAVSSCFAQGALQKPFRRVFFGMTCTV